jgi:hypothetical protein
MASIHPYYIDIVRFVAVGAGGGWALGSVQMGNSGMGGALRPQQQQQHAFQDRMVGSGPATPLDLS